MPGHTALLNDSLQSCESRDYFSMVSISASVPCNVIKAYSQDIAIELFDKLVDNPLLCQITE